MDPSAISVLRLCNQLIEKPYPGTAVDALSLMGAIQAQDYNMSKWALGIRLQASTERAIDNEIDAGRIIRMHLLRPTWHLVSSADVRWMLELSVSHIKAAARFRDKQLELTDSVFNRSNRIIENALKDNQHKTREELIKDLLSSKIRVDENRASHIFLRAEMDGIICSGKQKESKPTYTLLEEWVPGKNKKLYREEALKELGRRYFNTRGPATVEDFSWWAGLSVKESRIALNLNKAELLSEKTDNSIYWFPAPPGRLKRARKDIYLLPAYDEFLISYHDRRASLSQCENQKAVSNNGIFYPAILVNGQVTGIWKRYFKKEKLIVSARLFNSGDQNPVKELKKALLIYSGFTGRKAELIMGNSL